MRLLGWPIRCQKLPTLSDGSYVNLDLSVLGQKSSFKNPYKESLEGKSFEL